MKGSTKILVYRTVMFIVFVMATMILTPMAGFVTNTPQKLITDSMVTLCLFITATALGRSTKGF